MSKFWSPFVRDLVPYVPGEQPKLTKLVKLNTNENPYGPSPKALAAMQAHPAGRGAAIIGRATEGEAGRVTLQTTFGSSRIVDMLVGEQLPRIC